ncbi:MAG: gstB [Myxococcales bacterium]|jgi:glutathione S-transferase|nr:gstB [Myxococcales bacterium]
MELVVSRNSGNSARSTFALKESGVAWEPRFVDPREGQNHTAAHLALNPMGKVPALVDGDTVLWESNAINWYLAEKHPESRLLPASPAGRASVQRWLFFQAGHVSPACGEIVRATHPRVREFWRFKSDDAVVTSARRELSRYLPVVDTALETRSWLEGELSLADIAYVPHLWLIGEAGFDFSPYPALRAWLDRLVSRPAWKATADLIFGF